jgi:hypothetical protein
MATTVDKTPNQMDKVSNDEYIIEDFLRPLADAKGIKECLDKYGAVGIT